MNADTDFAYRRSNPSSRNKYRLAVISLAVIVALSIAFLTVNSNPAAGATQTATEPVFQAQGGGTKVGACELWQGEVFKTGRKGIGKVPLRWGRPDKSPAGGPFGVRHIADDHGGWTSYKLRAMRYIVNRAPITSKGNGKVVLTGRYAENGNTPKRWRLVVGVTKRSCPNKDLPTGVITFHRKS